MEKKGEKANGRLSNDICKVALYLMWSFYLLRYQAVLKSLCLYQTHHLHVAANRHKPVTMRNCDRRENCPTIFSRE